MKGVIPALKKARAFVSKGWLQGVAAKNAQGEPLDLVAVIKKEAVAFCMSAAMEQACTSEKMSGEAHRELAATIDMEDREKWMTNLDVVVNYNDEKKRTKRQVLGIFDKTLNRLRKGK
jgi:hypothetical protein